MNLLNAEGTNKENFSIGIGDKKVDLRTIDGKLFFREFGGGYQRVGTQSASTAIIPKTWSPQTEYVKDELLYFGGAIWRVKNSHTSQSVFNQTANQLAKISDITNFTNINTTSTSSPTTLPLNASEFIRFEGGGTSFQLNLVPANLFDIGKRFFLINSSLATIEIRNNSGNPLFSMLPNSAYIVTLLGNATEDGNWSSFTIITDALDEVLIRVTNAPGALVVGDIVQLGNSGSWEKINYNTEIKTRDFTFGRVGIVKSILPTQYTVLISGIINFDNTPVNLTPNTNYFLSKTINGAFSTDESELYVFRSIDTKNAIFQPAKWDRHERVITQINQNNNFLPGTPVRIGIGGTWVAAQAGNRTTLAQGLVYSNTGTFFNLISAGKITLTTNQWDALTGETGGLTPGNIYYLSETPGMISPVPVRKSQILLYALSATEGIVPSAGGGGLGGEGSTILTIQQANTFDIGDPVYFNTTSNNWELAIANDISKISSAIVIDASPSEFDIILVGEIELTTAQWDVLTGGTGGLTPGRIYYLTDYVNTTLAPRRRYTTLAPAIINPLIQAINSRRAIVFPGIKAVTNGTGQSFIEENFVATSAQTVFTLSYRPLGKAYVWVTINGVVETNFSFNGNDIVLDYPVTAGFEVFVKYVKEFRLDTRNNIIPFFQRVTASSQTTFLLPVSPGDPNYVLVWIDGVFETAYTIVGNQLIFDFPVTQNKEVVARIINSVNFDIGVDNFIKRKAFNLNANGGTTLISTQFGENLAGEYRIKVVDRAIGGTIYLKPGTGGEIVSNLLGAASNTFNNPNTLNIDFDSGTIRIQNNTSSNLQIIVVRET